MATLKPASDYNRFTEYNRQLAWLAVCWEGRLHRATATAAKDPLTGFEDIRARLGADVNDARDLQLRVDLVVYLLWAITNRLHVPFDRRTRMFHCAMREITRLPLPSGQSARPHIRVLCMQYRAELCK